jgi:hypothetical protein
MGTVGTITTEIIDAIKNNTKESYKCSYYDGRKSKNVANYGAQKGDIASILRKGEYNGLTIQFLENIKYLLNDKLIIKIIKLLNKEEFITCMNILNVDNVTKIYYILIKWLELNNIEHTIKIDQNELNNLENSGELEELNEWVKMIDHSPINGKIKIINVGYNNKTGASVVPDEWLDKEFQNGYHLHTEMNKLDTRIGKPPVTFCCTYSSMILLKNDDIVESNNIEQLIKAKKIVHLYIIKIKKNNITPVSKYYNLTSNNIDNISIFNNTNDTNLYKFVRYGNLLIGFRYSELFNETPIYDKSIEVGVLASRLQKAIRRGRYGGKILKKTIIQLNKSPNYNLPEQQFIRVNASKQLVWRLFITILEDVRPYHNENEINFLELILLVLITQKITNLQFNNFMLNKIIKLGLLAQYNDKKKDSYKWNHLEDTPISQIDNIGQVGVPFIDSIILALHHVPMMHGDKNMLLKYLYYDEALEPFIIPKHFTYLPDVNNEIIRASYDHHCKPYIILYYQACTDNILSTKNIPRYIWDISSRYNIRKHNTQSHDILLSSIQDYLINNDMWNNEVFHENEITQGDIEINFSIINKNDKVKRTTFLILFGQKYKYKNNDIIIAGTEDEPIRIKLSNKWEYLNDIDMLNAYPPRKIYLKYLDPPFGYKWKYDIVNTEIIDGKFYVNPDGNEIKLFDGTDIIEAIYPIEFTRSSLPDDIIELINTVLSNQYISFKNIIKMKNTKFNRLYDWYSILDFNVLDIKLIKLVYTKLFNQINNIITIGPIDRSGSKLYNSINYFYEGKIWKVFNMLSMLYPNSIKPINNLNFQLKKNTPDYIHMVTTFEKILFNGKTYSGIIPSVCTKLWDHQLESVNKIISGFMNGYRGYGDASDVGSGKTLTSLTIASNIISANNSIFRGVLVLLPNNKLINTWKLEIKKHTNNFDTIIYNGKNNFNIKRNTIVISTMSKMRDHPLYNKWLLVIIDECLSVQNKNALQTEEAWKQSLCSKYLLMMSATFFRTKFDKLYYMLKMLKTGLPERKEYLDTILLESIVCQMSKIKRNWISNINYFTLPENEMLNYENIASLDISIDKKFSKLSSYLINNEIKNVVALQLKKLVSKCNKNGNKCLIYAKSNDETEIFSTILNIPIYPEKTNNTIVTYNNGTYGLNDLIEFNTIVMRPPEPDKLPQIKGRLDRPGQENDNLYIEYFILKDTIEEGLILRLNIASNFMHHHIMPLAKFYEISVNHANYSKNLNH